MRVEISMNLLNQGPLCFFLVGAEITWVREHGSSHQCSSKLPTNTLHRIEYGYLEAKEVCNKVATHIKFLENHLTCSTLILNYRFGVRLKMNKGL